MCVKTAVFYEVTPCDLVGMWVY